MVEIPVNSDAVLSLIITDFSQVTGGRNADGDQHERDLQRLSNFLDRSLDAGYRNSLEESAPVFGLADLIASHGGPQYPG